MGTCFEELRIWQKIKKARQSKVMLVVVVYIALFLDYILLTVVVPIIPSFLYEKHQAESIASTSPELTSTPPSVFSHPTRKDFALEGNTTVAEVETRVSEWSNATGVAIPDVLHAQCARNDSFLDEESFRFGMLLASKAIVQLVVNPFVGVLTNRIGYNIPMFTGLLIIFVSTIMYAFSNTYLQLFVARALQGIGSSCSSVAGLGMLASNYTDDDERGKAIGIALGGVALGVLIGAPFGSVMYEFAGKSSPFLILAALTLLNGGLQLWILQPTMPTPESQKGSSLFTLLRDPYILIATETLVSKMLGSVLKQINRNLIKTKVACLFEVRRNCRC